jgi:hypothetical protein
MAKKPHGAPSSVRSRPPLPADESARPPDVSEKDRARLMSEIGAFSAAGVERAAWGWDQHASRDLGAYREAERAALHAIEKADRGEAWEEFRRYGAALGLFARRHITTDQFATLARPMDEALPWLLPKEPPHPYAVRDREV